MRLQDLSIVTNTSLDSNTVLLERFKAHDRVVYDPKTDLYSYRVRFPKFAVSSVIKHFLQHDFSFRNKAALLTEIQRSTRKGGGLSVRALRDSWKEAPQAIEELEKEGDVLVTRTTKDQQMRMVFFNEIKPKEDTGGMSVEQGKSSVRNATSELVLMSDTEFKDLWHGLKVPPDADLLRALSSGMIANCAICYFG